MKWIRGEKPVHIVYVAAVVLAVFAVILTTVCLGGPIPAAAAVYLLCMAV